MDHTFMTIHNLTPDATILFASHSITEILGYQPDDIKGRSCFDYFHPEEIPFARAVHNRGVSLDKAAVLHYARIQAADGRWVSCECCFTVVHDVLVACTSIYRRGAKSERRAMEAPHIRRLFSSSPRDPRYHMLEHLSPKFRMPPVEREPRAALILNRFSRNLPIMFATNAVATILGLQPHEIQDKSLYQCIQQNCLTEAIRCLERAKQNDSIAYLRFWYRDPRQDDQMVDDEAEEADYEDEVMHDDSSDSEDGGVELDQNMDEEGSNGPFTFHRESATNFPEDREPSPGGSHQGSRSPSIGEIPPYEQAPPVELEAVVSCTSDGLVVVLRKARPPIPAAHPPLMSVDYENGLFAAPWAHRPIRPRFPPQDLYRFQSPLLPQHMPLQEKVRAAGGPPLDQLMRSIRDVAVFAWALVGINGNLVSHSHGSPHGEAQPEDGLPIWDRATGDYTYAVPGDRDAFRKQDKGKGPAYQPHPSYGIDGPSYTPVSSAAANTYSHDRPQTLAPLFPQVHEQGTTHFVPAPGSHLPDVLPTPPARHPLTESMLGNPTPSYTPASGLPTTQADENQGGASSRHHPNRFLWE